MKYVVSQGQLQVLIALCGIGQFPFLGQPRGMKDAEMIQAIARLYRVGCLEEQQGRMKPVPPLEALLQRMASAETVIRFWFGDHQPLQHLVCPVGRDEMVILEKAAYTEEAVFKLWQEPAVNYLHDLFEAELLPRCLTRDREEARALEELAWQQNPPEQQDLRPLLRVERTRARTGCRESQVEVGQSSVFTWICCRWDGTEMYHLYSEEELAELLLKEMRGNTQ